MQYDWDLTPLYKGFDDPAFADDLQALKEKVAAFAELAEVFWSLWD